jgi:hypothetical protein
MALFLNRQAIGLAVVLALFTTAAAEPDTEVRAPAPKGEETAAEKLYVSKCSKCHKFYDPAKYSDSQWAKWMGKMSKKSKLNPEQQKELSQYIQGKYRSGAARQ